MKTTFKVLGALVIVVAMVYNVRISRQAASQETVLAYVKNAAQADEENPQKYATKTSDNYTRTTTVQNSNGTTCTVTATYAVTECGGTGNLDCTASSVITDGPHYSGNCN